MPAVDYISGFLDSSATLGMTFLLGMTYFELGIDRRRF